MLTHMPQPYGERWAIPTTGGTAHQLTHNEWEDGLARWGVFER